MSLALVARALVVLEIILQDRGRNARIKMSVMVMWNGRDTYIARPYEYDDYAEWY